MIRSKIKEISNVYFDMFDAIACEDTGSCQESNLMHWCIKNNMEDVSFGVIVSKLQEYLNAYNYKLLFAYNMVDIPIETIKGDVVGKFFIIKNEDVFLDKIATRPLTVYAEKDIVGKIIGTGGSNIKSIMGKLNNSNSYWKVPYIKVSKLEERTTNNKQEELNKKFLELLDNIF